MLILHFILDLKWWTIILDCDFIVKSPFKISTSDLSWIVGRCLKLLWSEFTTYTYLNQNGISDLKASWTLLNRANLIWSRFFISVLNSKTTKKFYCLFYIEDLILILLSTLGENSISKIKPERGVPMVFDYFDAKKE